MKTLCRRACCAKILHTSQTLNLQKSSLSHSPHLRGEPGVVHRRNAVRVARCPSGLRPRGLEMRTLEPQPVRGNVRADIVGVADAAHAPNVLFPPARVPPHAGRRPRWRQRVRSVQTVRSALGVARRAGVRAGVRRLRREPEEAAVADAAAGRRRPRDPEPETGRRRRRSPRRQGRRSWRRWRRRQEFETGRRDGRGSSGRRRCRQKNMVTNLLGFATELVIV